MSATLTFLLSPLEVKWLLSARSRDNHLPVLTGIVVTKTPIGTFAYATDTHRLHAVRISDEVCEEGVKHWSRPIPYEALKAVSTLGNQGVWIMVGDILATLSPASKVKPKGVAEAEPPKNAIAIHVPLSNAASCPDTVRVMPDPAELKSDLSNLAVNASYVLEAIKGMGETTRLTSLRCQFYQAAKDRPLVVLNGAKPEDYRKLRRFAIIMPMAWEGK